MVVVGEFGQDVALGINEIPAAFVSDLGTSFSERVSILEDRVDGHDAIWADIAEPLLDPDQGAVVLK